MQRVVFIGVLLTWSVIALVVLLNQCDTNIATVVSDDRPPLQLTIHAPRTVDTYVPSSSDTTRLKGMLRTIDSLRTLLTLEGVRRTVRFDTTVHHTYGIDSIRIECDEISRTASIDVRYAPKPIPITRRAMSAFLIEAGVQTDFQRLLPYSSFGARLSLTDYLDVIAQVQATFTDVVTVRPSAAIRVEF